MGAFWRYKQTFRNEQIHTTPNAKNCELHFSKSDPILDPIVVNNQPLEIVKSAKLLGMDISSDLKWNIHITEIMKKYAPRFNFVRQLKQAHLATSELLTFYLCCIRPIAEYGCQLFHNALPKHLSADLERIQKRALRIIHPELTYNNNNNFISIFCVHINIDINIFITILTTLTLIFFF